MAEYYGLYTGELVPELASALGDMILAWTSVEEIQARAMAAMLKIDINDAMRLYQNFPNFRSRTQMLYTLLDLHQPYEQIRGTIAAVSKLSKTRNRYVHGSFLFNPEKEGEILSIDYAAPEEAPSRSKPCKAGDIKNHSDAVRTRAVEFESELRKIRLYRSWLRSPLGPV